ncbi:MAG: DUF4367 domain-containing protein [Clostridiales bacterium]|nr:DUF4367 domain-containing protein [Clostridiales bacterium]
MAICYIDKKREWNRLKSAAFDHPFYDKKANRLSEREAEQMIRSRDLPDGKTAIAEICRNLEIEMPEDGIEERKEPINPAAWMRRRRWIAAVAIALLLLCFFTLTKPGITLAKEISNVIVEWITNQFGARNVEPESAAAIDFTTLPAEYEDIHAVAMATGRTLTELCDPNYVLAEMTVRVHESNSITVRMEYRDGEKQVMLTQKLYSSDVSWGESVNMKKAKETESSIGKLFLVGITTDDTVAAMAYKDGYMINLQSNSLSAAEIEGLLASLEKVEP